MEIKACPKINLGLRVLRRRTDGFHDIETAMIAVRGLYDTVSVRSLQFVPATPPPYFAPPEVSATSTLETTGGTLDCPPEKNICMRALRLLQHELGIGEALIKLHKVVPSGAGLGGGSSDAAATLLAINQEFTLQLTDAELENFAAELGCDVPFFIRALSPKASHLSTNICTGRGEILTPFPSFDLSGKWLAILKPVDLHVSTAEAYSGVAPNDSGASVSEALKRPIEEWRTLLVNDFESSVFTRHPEIAALKQSLYNAGAIYASMSGSGSAVFGIFDVRPKLSELPLVHVERL